MQSTLKPIKIQRNGAEMPLFILSILVSLPIIALLIISIVGIFYALVFAVIMFIGHMTAISYIRGSGILVTSEQLPEFFQEIEGITQRIGLARIPEIYIIQGNGMLNAMATKFLFTRIFVIYSNLIDACENNSGARAMIIGHELGHLHAGHLRWRWLIWPSHFVPFLAGALSRAREYTADKYGYACVENKEDGLRGLLILAGGKQIASKVSIDSFAAQIKSLNTGFMRLGEWLHTHPTLVRRVCALEENFHRAEFKAGSKSSVVKALTMIIITYGSILTVLVVIGVASYNDYVKKALAREQNTEQSTNYDN